MTTLLTVIAVALGYLLVGGFYARSQAVPAYQRARRAGWCGEQGRRESVTLQLLWRTAFWPYAVPFDLVRGPVRNWMQGPLDARIAHAEQLREDARAWRAKQYTGTPAERAMAEELARVCDELAKEVEL